MGGLIAQSQQTVCPLQCSKVAGVVSGACTQDALKLRGTHGIITLGKKFKSIDDDGDKKISMEEFRKVSTGLCVCVWKFC